MIAPGAKFNLSEKQEQVFKADAKLFSNRNHKLAEPPKKFRKLASEKKSGPERRDAGLNLQKTEIALHECLSIHAGRSFVSGHCQFAF